MRLKPTFTPAVLALSLVLCIPTFAQTMDPGQSTQAPIPGDSRAQKMSPARAALKETLDANKVQTGFTFHAILAQKVKLIDGPILPEGTTLTGTVVEDDMKVEGISKLALRFTSATTKSGETVPIRAMIVGVEPPVLEDGRTSVVNEGDQAPNNWTSKTLQVDQIGVMSGIDLHSAIASHNSGIFVSTKAKAKDVKLMQGSELALAIGARPEDSNGPSSGLRQ
jgi:hypothetical protein